MIWASLVACSLSGPDGDGDGLPDRREVELGTDPAHPDSDGDGLMDGEELELGSDPLSEDTDGDGYLDGDEVFEGTDPTDPDSRIYTGGWPYRRDKSALADPTYEDRAWPGEPSHRLYLTDQFGDVVDLADFAQPDVEVLLEFCALWSAECLSHADWRVGRPSGSTGLSSTEVRTKLENGTGFWITILPEGEDRGPPTETDVVAWTDEFGDSVPVLLDTDGAMRDWFHREVDAPGLSRYVLLTDDLTIRHIDNTEDFNLNTALLIFGGRDS